MASSSTKASFSSIHGKLPKQNETYYTTRYGQTVASNYPIHKDPSKITARQKERYSIFAQAVQQTNTELTNPDRKAYWQEQFSHQPEPRKYKTLRGFIIG